MRKIERQLNEAITNNTNWSLANSTVTYNPDSNESKVYLHGNHIATVGTDFVQLFDGGWRTPTTKSRLNAICDTHAVAGEGVFQKKGEWFVRTINTNTNEWHTVPFVNGIKLA